MLYVTTLHEALSCSSFHLKTVIFCYLTWLGPPEENIFIKNAVALYFYAEDNKLYVFCDRERKNLFIHLKTVSNVLSVTLLVKVFLCQLLTVSRGVMSPTTKEAIPYETHNKLDKTVLD